MRGGRAAVASSAAPGPLQRAPHPAPSPEPADDGHPRSLRLLDRRGAVHPLVSPRQEVHRDDGRGHGDHGDRRGLRGGQRVRRRIPQYLHAVSGRSSLHARRGRLSPPAGSPKARRGGDRAERPAAPAPAHTNSGTMRQGKKRIAPGKKTTKASIRSKGSAEPRRPAALGSRPTPPCPSPERPPHHAAL